MELSLQTGTVADHTVVQVGGEIDVYTAPQLRQRLHDLVEGGTKHIVVDLRGVEFLDSHGLGVLLGALKQLRAQGGNLVLVCVKESVLRVFRVTGLESPAWFTIVPSVDAAVALDNSGPTER